MASSSSIAATGMTPLTAFRLTDGQPFEQIKSIDILDQLLLPHDIQWEKVQTIQQAFDAIKSMKVDSFFPLGRREQAHEADVLLHRFEELPQ